MPKKKDAERTGVDRWNEGASGRNRAKANGRKSNKLPRDARRWAGTLVVLVAVLVACAIAFTPLDKRITQGLDIQGGVSVIMTASKTDGGEPSADEMATATTIVQNRVNSLGASEATVQQQGSNSILIQIPGATDAQAAVETIGKTGYLEFVRLDEIGDADALAQINAGKQGVKLKEGTYTAFMDGSSIKSSGVAQSSNMASGEWAVNVSLNDKGRETFAQVTSDLAPTHGRIAIVLDGVVDSAPAVVNPITDGNVSITGGYNSEQAQALKTVLDSGSLPVTLNYSESRVVGPTLGQDSLSQGLTAIAVGMAIVVFAIVYLGILAVLSHFGLFALSLPGLAGIVLTIGMAADSSILVLERFREEIRMGRTIRNASISGVKHGIGTSVDADMVTFVSAVALFFVAVGPVKGFGLTLALGILCDLVTMFAFKAPALRLLARGTIQANPAFWGVADDIEEAEAARVAASGKGGVANA